MGEMLPAITHNLQRQKQNIGKLMKRLGKKQAAQIIQTRNLKNEQTTMHQCKSVIYL